MAQSFRADIQTQAIKNPLIPPMLLRFLKVFNWCLRRNHDTLIFVVLFNEELGGKNLCEPPHICNRGVETQRSKLVMSWFMDREGVEDWGFVTSVPQLTDQSRNWWYFEMGGGKSSFGPCQGTLQIPQGPFLWLHSEWMTSALHDDLANLSEFYLVWEWGSWFLWQNPSASTFWHSW